MNSTIHARIAAAPSPAGARAAGDDPGRPRDPSSPNTLFVRAIMQTDHVKSCAHRRRGIPVKDTLILAGIGCGVGCALVTTSLHVHTPAWWAALTVTTVIWLAEIVLAGSHTHGCGRFDDFLNGQNISLGCTPLVAMIVAWHHPHAARWAPLLAMLGAAVLAVACWAVAAWIRRRGDRTP
ncbi:MAG TPA: hypothetical protein VF292_13575 [Rhodanobacteraceae bacterium]